MKLTNPMLRPRVAKALSNTAKAWWYVSPKAIDVFCMTDSGHTPACSITRRQLEQALAIMRAAENGRTAP